MLTRFFPVPLAQEEGQCRHISADNPGQRFHAGCHLLVSDG